MVCAAGYGLRLAPEREDAAERVLRCLTFELTGSQRQATSPGLVKMYRVPPARGWWPAVGSPVERGVRPHAAQCRLALSDDTSSSAYRFVAPYHRASFQF
jgi:hypothetical protein